jgi:hypothetical protein
MCGGYSKRQVIVLLVVETTGLPFPSCAGE